jgi:hypothetical protein
LRRAAPKLFAKPAKAKRGMTQTDERLLPKTTNFANNTNPNAKNNLKDMPCNPIGTRVLGQRFYKNPNV